MIHLIWAMDENWLVGKDDKLPWHIPNDLKHFQKMTKDKTVLMGHETYLSMKGYYKTKPFPFKKVYVANLNEFYYEDAIWVSDIKIFLENISEELFVIGGPTIYRLALPYAKYLHITFILNKYSGNVYFPKFSLNEFKVKTYQTLPGLIFTTYEKR